MNRHQDPFSTSPSSKKRKKDAVENVLKNAIKGVAFSRNLEQLRTNVDITIREVSEIAKAGDPFREEAPRDVSSETPGSKKAGRPETRENVPSSSAASAASQEHFRKPSYLSSTVMVVLGTFLTVVLWGAALVCSLLHAFVISFPLLAALGVVCGVLGILPLILAISGGKTQRKIKRFNRYCSFLGEASFCSLEQLASHCRQSLSFTRKDVSSMIAAGWFPNGHLDLQETTLMLDEETYRQYLLAEEARKQREREEAAVPSSGNQALDEAIREGRVYIREIRKTNDKIAGEEMSRKISDLEEITVKIFACVERHPEKLPEIRRFMSYYLPTTLKLLNAYAEFDAQPVREPGITHAKEEISQALDTIRQAFSSLLGSLYENDILDISSDISVLRAMFAQEGLTDSSNFPS